MSEVKEYILIEPGEAEEAYRQRLHDIAKPLHAKYMDDVQARWQAEQDKRARRDEIDDARARAALRPVQNVTVQQERMSQKQSRLTRNKEKFHRD
jgi:hypothetical protein